ncbi:diguanylate cyclase (GGDEF) domain-containing protein [Asanoa hainanensis]|uniref:Diguanylate cyclase (GGDEF) domain-containing protein n=1 Tax=Asanoa hainanensis TaxID=560556 RepID=A0A239NMC7_9ACTN|nr:GGDEF domain-containing protein [Asanoa hainanensis]SNT56026.1 diguanylate cyclase (GGDEF) domain-containing protein [Asanoa hainanensis]
MVRVLGGVFGIFAVAALLIWLGPAPAITSWSAQAALEGTFAWLAWRLWRRPGQPARARLFWGAAAVAGALKTVGGLVRVVQFAVDPAGAGRDITVSTLVIAGGSIVLLAFLLTRPGATTGRERARMWLDAATVLIATAVFVWSIALIGSEQATGPLEIAWTVIGSVITIAAAFAVVRLVMIEDAPFSRATGAVLAAAIALFGVSHMLNPQLAAADSRGIFVLRMLPALALVVGACVEWLRRGPARTSGPLRPSPVTLRLPFFAVAATQLMLIIQLPIVGLTIESWGTVVGAVLLTTIVTARQGVVLADNERLVHRLGETVEALGRQEERLRHAANHDHLTGLANRAFFDQHAQHLGSSEPGHGRAVLLLDLNEFKLVNDTFGHHAGDDLLKTAATRLRRSVRPGDTVARLGGDEFSVLLADTSADDAVATARRILRALAEPVRIHGRTLRPAASVGIAASRTKPFESLLRDADEAMYEAKRRHSGLQLHPDSTG